MESVEIAAIAQDIRDNIPGFRAETIVFEGEGDFCRAYTVNDRWIFRFAHNDEGSRTLEREAALLPKLAPEVHLAIPNIAYFGRRRADGRAFVGYPKIQGVELTRERLLALGPLERERCARDLAGFLDDLHSFGVSEARLLGVPECDYPFCRTEDGIMGGTASDLYRQELRRLLDYPILDKDARRYCERLVDQLLDEAHGRDLPPTLAHGDLSQDHVLLDHETQRVAGVIDLSDAIITTPALDFTYLYHAYGKEFLALVLRHYHGADPQRITAVVLLLHQWYTVIRLLWALDNNYQPGIAARLRDLNVIATSPPQF
jgi:aminoglycoside 2''-phosphotransferase